MAGLAGWEIVLLGIAALLVGFAKTAVGGVGSISVAIFAAVLPARESTGALLPLLLVGDLVAIHAYRAHAHWATLVRLLPSVVVGMLAGAAFVSRVDDVLMRRTIGAILLALVCVHVVRRRGGRTPGTHAGWRGRAASSTYGLLAGFTTMVANAGGPVMSLYLLSARLGVLGFLGTGAWFFFLVNGAKVPFSMGLDLITPASLLLDALLAPLVLLGAFAGRRVVSRMDLALFERVVLLVTVLSAGNLLR